MVNTKVYSNENLLTIQQQLERLQREVTDISKLIYSDDVNLEKTFDETLSKNLSAISRLSMENVLCFAVGMLYFSIKSLAKSLLPSR